MKHITTLTVACAAMLSAFQLHARDIILANFGWRFHAGDVAEAANLTFDDSSWRVVDVPHDFQIEQPWVAPGSSEQADNSDPGNNVRSLLSPRGFKTMGVGWYRKTFRPDEAWRGQRVLVDFEGIMLVGDVWLNGQRIGGTDYGYLGFESDITELLRWDEDNVLAVRADTRQAENSRWYTGGGLYRDVHFVVTDAQQYITRHGLRIVATPVEDSRIQGVHPSTGSGTEVQGVQEGSEGTWDVSIQVETANLTRSRENHYEVDIYDSRHQLVATQKTTLPLRQRTWEYTLPTLQMTTPHLWNVDDPYLYTAVVKVLRNDDSVADSVTQRFGLRTVEIGPDFGLKVNGDKVLLKGIANHHTLGALGAAAYPRAIEKRLQLLKDYGFNHIRSSHNPYSESFLDLCDEMGILVVDELYDKWLTRYAGGRTPWTDMWQHDIPEWVKRDRNHPCIVFWSLGNELQTYADLPYNDWGVTPYRMQRELLRRYDNTRQLTVAMHPRGIHDERDSLIADLARVTDIASYNYRYMYFPMDGAKYPWMTFYQSEAAMTGLGPNFFEMDLERVIGLAYWGAIDYLGESQGWPAKGWAQGCFNIDLTPKPNAWLMRSIFRDDEPVVHLSMTTSVRDIEWNGVAQKIMRQTDQWMASSAEATDDLRTITAYTNCDEVELLVNGKSQGTRHNPRHDAKHRNKVSWDKIPFAPGNIEAIARNDGKVVAHHRVETPGQVARLVITPDNTTWQADGMDLQHLTVTAVDKKGRRVAWATDDIQFEVEGDARLVAVSSGDHYSDELNTTHHRRLYDGQCLVILRAGHESGQVTLQASAGPKMKASYTTRTIAAQ